MNAALDWLPRHRLTVADYQRLAMLFRINSASIPQLLQTLYLLIKLRRINKTDDPVFAALFPIRTKKQQGGRTNNPELPQ